MTTKKELEGPSDVRREQPPITGTDDDPRCRLCGDLKSQHTKSLADWRTIPGCTGHYVQPSKPSAPPPLIGASRVRAESLWEELGGDLCICQRGEVLHWCEKCQGRIDLISAALSASPVVTPDEYRSGSNNVAESGPLQIPTVQVSSDPRQTGTPSGSDMEKMFHEMPLADLVDRIENYNSFESEGGPLRFCIDWQVLKARVLTPAAGSHEDAFNGGYALGRSDHARMRDGGHEIGSREGFRRWLKGTLLR